MRLLPLLTLTALLASCAPGPTTDDTLKGPLIEGEQWTLSGADQNGEPLSGKVTVPGEPRYNRTDREWYYRGDGVRLYFEERSGEFQVWDSRNPAHLVICLVWNPYRYDPQQKTFSGIGVTGSMQELDAVFAKLSGSGTRLTGGNCTVTRL